MPHMVRYLEVTFLRYLYIPRHAHWSILVGLRFGFGLQIRSNGC